jgi:phosphate transport system permease protein
MYYAVIFCILLTLYACSYYFVNRKLKRKLLEFCGRGLLLSASILMVSITIMIIVVILFEAQQFFAQVPILNFLTGVNWSPQSADIKNSFGVVALFAGTFLITIIAMIIAVPIGIFAAVFVAEYASKNIRNIIKPMLEILAGIPTVVYGYFAALFIGPFIRDIGESMGFEVSTESALAAGIAMGIMIIPFIMSVTDDVLFSIPRNLREAGYALGSTKSEVIAKIVLPAAMTGIVSAVLLAISRAIGETMIVAMAAGLTANLTANPLESVTTITVQIVNLLVGDDEFDSAKTLASYALGITLFVVTLFLNVASLIIVKNYKKKYEF